MLCSALTQLFAYRSNTDAVVELSSPNPPDVENEGFKESSDIVGLDWGLPTFDVPGNDDSPALQPWSKDDQNLPRDLAAGTQIYAPPVSIDIPRSLNPLPSTLTQNPMNLLYFDHFSKHTASTLVAHDCADNPFRNILPKSKYVVVLAEHEM